jgi:hypothetical protein
MSRLNGFQDTNLLHGLRRLGGFAGVLTGVGAEKLGVASPAIRNHPVSFWMSMQCNSSPISLWLKIDRGGYARREFAQQSTLERDIIKTACSGRKAHHPFFQQTCDECTELPAHESLV